MKSPYLRMLEVIIRGWRLFATLGALIGAGGYGQPILTGIRLDDYGLILQGALPAAALALLATFFYWDELFLAGAANRIRFSPA
jgi:ABC-type proline/glycine betaine transport system permease subunit